MTNLTISLPSDIKAFLDEEVSSGNYASPAELVCDMLKKKKIEKLLLERLEKVERGETTEMTKADWRRLRARLIARHGKAGPNEKEKKDRKAGRGDKGDRKHSRLHRKG